MSTLQTRRQATGQAPNPWTQTYTVTITTDSGPTAYVPDFMFYSDAATTAAKLIDLLELGNETGLVVTIGQRA